MEPGSESFSRGVKAVVAGPPFDGAMVLYILNYECLNSAGTHGTWSTQPAMGFRRKRPKRSFDPPAHLFPSRSRTTSFWSWGADKAAVIYKSYMCPTRMARYMSSM